MAAELTTDQRQQLIAAARLVRERAHAPYSNFPVGAAILGADNQIYVGCNVENASLGLTVCAERAAVANAIAHGCREFAALAVVADSDGGFITPCGACRQVLAEFNADLPIICCNDAGQSIDLKLNDLLPLRFEFGPNR